MKMQVYVASTLSNYARTRQVQQMLRDRGHDITYDWTAHGHELKSDPEELKEIALGEAHGVKNADLFVMVTPGQKGAHFEMGIAWHKQIPIIIFEDKPLTDVKSFYFLDEVDIVKTEGELWDLVAQYYCNWRGKVDAETIPQKVTEG